MKEIQILFDLFCQIFSRFSDLWLNGYHLTVVFLSIVLIFLFILFVFSVIMLFVSIFDLIKLLINNFLPERKNNHENQSHSRHPEDRQDR